MADIHVMLAMPTSRDIPRETVLSLMETQGLLQERNISFTLYLSDGGSLVHNARTKAAHHFLKSECTHLFWVDSDIVWKAEDFLRILALATKMECVAASYPLKRDDLQFVLNVKNPLQTVKSDEYGCIEVNSLGVGFTCVQRKVIEELAAKAPAVRISHYGIMPRIFRLDDPDNVSRGEDIAFFDDIRALGYKVHLDPKIELGHVGPKVYRGAVSQFLKRV